VPTPDVNTDKHPAREQERTRIEKECKAIEEDIGRANKKLKSLDFNAKAPKEVIAGVRARKEELEKKLNELKSQMDQLKQS
jgi:valyl-tRNA synthetase